MHNFTIWLIYAQPERHKSAKFNIAVISSTFLNSFSVELYSQHTRDVLPQDTKVIHKQRRAHAHMMYSKQGVFTFNFPSAFWNL